MQDNIDQNLLRAIEALSLSETSLFSLKKDPSRNESFKHLSSNPVSTNASSSNNSSPTEPLSSCQMDEEIDNAASSLFDDLSYICKNNPNYNDYDKQKFLLAVLGNTDIIADALKKIRQLLSIGKRMEAIYRAYYVDPNLHIDLQELGQLIDSFSKLYNEKYVREVNVSRVYEAFCQKMIQIYNLRTNSAMEH